MKASIAGIVCTDNKLLLGLRNNTGQIGGLWEFPGGKCELGETHSEALVREFDEELGVAVRVGRYIGKTQFNNGRYDFEIHAYEVFIEQEQVMVCKEHQKMAFFSVDEIDRLEMVPSDCQLLPLIKAFFTLT